MDEKRWKNWQKAFCVERHAWWHKEKRGKTFYYAFYIMFHRFSPYEWEIPHICQKDCEGILINQFSLLNSLWFTIGELSWMSFIVVKYDCNNLLWGKLIKDFYCAMWFIVKSAAALEMPSDQWCTTRVPRHTSEKRLATTVKFKSKISHSQFFEFLTFFKNFNL
jgi:hypothetical protein